MLELSLYERVITGEDLRPLSLRDADDIRDSIWEKQIRNRNVLKYIAMLPELKDLQSQFEQPEYLVTEEFANTARRGLRVTPYQYCYQYEAFCKGFLLH